MNRKLSVGSGAGLALAGTSAQADMKDPLPDSLSLGGVTLYGTVDVGYAYQSKGVPLNSQYLGRSRVPGLHDDTEFHRLRDDDRRERPGAVQDRHPGVAADRQRPEPGCAGRDRVQPAVRPVDRCLRRARIEQRQRHPGEPERPDRQCRQQPLRPGVQQRAVWRLSSTSAGTLTFGRHNSLQLDALAQYDPQALSYAFSFLGYSGFNGGSGSTEAARWDNSIKYAYQNGPVHIAGMYTNGGQDTGILGRPTAPMSGWHVNGLLRLMRPTRTIEGRESQ
jgi:hypothetical protein